MRDAIVVGGGPAGLATAIAARQAGLDVVVCERRGGVVDKACGEGLLPPAIAALDRLGARRLLDPADCAPLDGVRWIEADGTAIAAPLPDGGGLGVRRTALWSALAERARAVGVELRAPCGVREVELARDLAIVHSDGGELRAPIVIGADGLGSRVRRAAGLALSATGVARFGWRQHVAVAPWSRAVEVHFSDGGDAIEAYVTPAGRARVGVAFLFERGAAERLELDALLARFPLLRARLAGAPVDSTARGAGPFAQRVRAPVADRVALVGDAAGYLDAITGEGLSIALACGAALGALLPSVIADGATRRSLAPYARLHARRYRRYALATHVMLALARRPRWRRRAFALLDAHPALLARLVAWAVGEHAFSDEGDGALAASAGSIVAATQRSQRRPQRRWTSEV